MIDDSTDISVRKQLVLYGQYVSESGEPCSTFLRFVDLMDGTAACIEEAIRAYLEEKGFALRKLMGFGVLLRVTWIGITSSHSISAEPGWMAC